MNSLDFNRLNGPQRKILRETLQAVFGNGQNCDIFLVENNYQPLANIVQPAPFRHQVFELIKYFIQRGGLNELLTDILRDYSRNPKLVDLRERLRFADDASEAQRVVKDRGLERMVRDAGFSDLNLWAQSLVEAGRRICRIAYPVSPGRMSGSGFLVASDLVLTNYHVMEYVLTGQASPDSVRLSFGYAETQSGLSAGDNFSLSTNWNVASAPYSQADLAPDGGQPAEKELDFSLVRLAKNAGASLVGNTGRGWFDLTSTSTPEEEDTIVFVLQHPEGKPLKQSIGVLKPSVTPLRLRYDADTEHGSSGGLVLDQRLAPIAIHHAGDPSSRIKSEYNQGIPLTLIRAALEANQPAPDRTP